MSDENTSCVTGQTEMSLENSTEYDPAVSKSQSEGKEVSKKQLPADMYYNYEDLHSRPIITPGCEIPGNLLHLSHSFGYDSKRRSNLKLLDDRILLFIAGNLLVLLDVPTKEQRYLRSCSGGGIGAMAVHPSGRYFAVAEKGNQPDIVVYEYPTLRLYRILRGGTEREFSFVDFNSDGSVLASVGGAPDYMLTLWDWMQEEVMISCKAISQEVYRVTFSPHNPGLLTTSGSGHIKFWKMISTFTGFKLRGAMGHFGKTPATDIEGYVELPDGKVLSGTEWGNLLLWDGNAIKAEICRKEGQSCHVGTVQPFALEDGQLLTIGSDGVVRGWDFDRINAAKSSSDSSRFELEPINEMTVGHNVCLSSVVRSSLPDSFLWFAQDSNGAIWKLDLSFTNTTPDPERLFSFHAGVIQGLDVSKKSHLMATTALDRSVKVFDLLAKQDLTTSHFNQGGTALIWAPPMVDQSGGLLVTGFEDGVVRILELYNPQSLQEVTERKPGEDAKLRLKQAFKPHSTSVTAVAYQRNGEILATGSADCTVFFFVVGEKYHPIGFIQVPGPVQSLEWSPHSHSDNRLLILCQNGHVVEVHCPDPKAHKSDKTFLMAELPRKSFRFMSIKSRLKREEELTRRRAEKDTKRMESKQQGAGQEDQDDKEEDVTPIYIPDPPSPLCCGFYSQPGQFWLSMGGFDSGYLYHCKFSENQDEDPDQRQDEPFGFLPIHNADEDPIRSIAFSSNRNLLYCGMHSGAIRVYPLEPDDHNLTSMQAYWSLNMHDNHYGHLRHVRCSYDDLFVLTAGDDGNVFSFSLLPPEELQKTLQRGRAKIPSPRVGLESETLCLDIEDPTAYSLEMAKQKQENDLLRRKAELRIAERQRKLAELQKRFKQVLNDNKSLPEHLRLKPEELQLDHHFYEHAEKLEAEKMMEVRKQFAWEQERISIALRKLQNGFKDSLEATVVTVVAIRSNHRVSTYSVASFARPQSEDEPGSSASQPSGDRDCKKSKAEPPREGGKVEQQDIFCPPLTRSKRVKLGDRQEERLRKAALKAKLARDKIEKRKQEWAQIYAEKPKKDYEDPQDLQAIREARENIVDFTVVKQQRATTEKKREELLALETNIREKQVDINGRILSLRDSKVRLVSSLHSQAQQLQKVQQRLAARLHRRPPTLPTMLPEETPEKRLQCSPATLERYCVLRDQRLKMLGEERHEDEEEAVSLLEQLEREKENEEEVRGDESTPTMSGPSITRKEEESAPDEVAELSEDEEELQKEEELRLLREQDSLLEQIESSVQQFDTELKQLRSQKLRLDYQLKLADLRVLTLRQEMLLLKQSDGKKEALQEKLNACMEEESSITTKLEEYNQQLELKMGEIIELERKEKSLTAAFQASMGENNKFEEFLTKVFRKKVKRVKKDQTVNEEEDDSEEESDEDWDEDFDSDTEESLLDDSVCPAGCEPELFENILQLRERRLDLEELMAEEKNCVEALKRDIDTLVKKEKLAKSNRKAAEDDVEIINKETQQKLNKLDVVVPLRLHQIEFVTNGAVPSDLSEALVLKDTELNRLQDCIQRLQEGKLLEKDLYRLAKQEHAKLICDCRDMTAKIQVLEEQCDELMMTKFGMLVDLESLQTLSGNRRLEELKHEKLLKEDTYDKEIQEWDRKVEEAQEALTEATHFNTECLRRTTDILEEKNKLEFQVNARQKKMGRQQFQDYSRCVDEEEVEKLQELVKTQSQHAEALRREIQLLSRQGGHVLPPNLDWLYGHAPLPSPSGNTQSGT